MTQPHLAPPDKGVTHSDGNGTTHLIRWAAPLLAVFWLLLSGHVDPLFVTFGVVSVVLTCVLGHRAGLGLEEGPTPGLVLRLPRYLLWLVKEVLISAVTVTRRVWSPRLDLSPVVARTSSRGLSPLTQVVYANSITLTPGTLSLDLDDEHVEVHALDVTGIEDLEDGRSLRQVRRLAEPR
ncbi:Na+/H+ antiporter subunit E [Nonomuraea sp. NPDC049504]|uniref:Na+/H+ antiporter subunit E n=1 Tax=Nonomuraea sp. NPDC049504 TaxID=3154729 RepID=UPI00343C8C68